MTKTTPRSSRPSNFHESHSEHYDLSKDHDVDRVTLEDSFDEPHHVDEYEPEDLDLSEDEADEPLDAEPDVDAPARTIRSTIRCGSI